MLDEDIMYSIFEFDKYYIIVSILNSVDLHRTYFLDIKNIINKLNNTKYIVNITYINQKYNCYIINSDLKNIDLDILDIDNYTSILHCICNINNNKINNYDLINIISFKSHEKKLLKNFKKNINIFGFNVLEYINI